MRDVLTGEQENRMAGRLTLTPANGRVLTRIVKMTETMLLIALRLIAASIFAAGAAWLASEGKDGWGWCIFAAIVLGCITISTKEG